MDAMFCRMFHLVRQTPQLMPQKTQEANIQSRLSKPLPALLIVTYLRVAARHLIILLTLPIYYYKKLTDHIRGHPSHFHFTSN